MVADTVFDALEYSAGDIALARNIGARGLRLYGLHTVTEGVLDHAIQNIMAVCDGEADVIANMATIACELFHGDTRFDWVGFYRNMGDDTLKIGPYQGGHGCLSIPFSKGVCGAAARGAHRVIVDNVNTFAGHIACASSTVSELVLPVFGPEGALLGVLDIDSNQPAAFTQADADMLETMLHDIFAKGQKRS